MFQIFKIFQRESQQYNCEIHMHVEKKKQLKMNIPDYILYMYMKVCLKLREENDSQHTLRKCVSVSGFTRHISVTNETPQTNTPDKRKENNI